MTTALANTDRQAAIAKRAQARGGTALGPALRTTGGGGRSTPITTGRHFFQFADAVDVTYQPSSYPQEDEPRPRVMYVFASDEAEDDGTPKVVPYWTSTSLFEGDRQYQMGGLLKLLRQVTGVQELAPKTIIDRWGVDGEFSVDTPVYPFDQNGNPAPGWVFSAEIEHQIERGRNGREFTRSKFVDGSIRRVTAEEWKANGHLADAYKRPSWVAKQEAASPQAPAAGIGGQGPDPVAAAKPVVDTRAQPAPDPAPAELPAPSFGMDDKGTGAVEAAIEAEPPF